MQKYNFFLVDQSLIINNRLVIGKRISAKVAKEKRNRWVEILFPPEIGGVLTPEFCFPFEDRIGIAVRLEPVLRTFN